MWAGCAEPPLWSGILILRHRGRVGGVGENCGSIWHREVICIPRRQTVVQWPNPPLSARLSPQRCKGPRSHQRAAVTEVAETYAPWLKVEVVVFVASYAFFCVTFQDRLMVQVLGCQERSKWFVWLAAFSATTLHACRFGFARPNTIWICLPELLFFSFFHLIPLFLFSTSKN